MYTKIIMLFLGGILVFHVISSLLAIELKVEETYNNINKILEILNKKQIILAYPNKIEG